MNRWTRPISASGAVKFMYSDATDMHFLDQEDYNQYSLPKEDLVEECKYLTEDLEGIQALIYNDECVGVQLPVTVELKVVQCDPGIKGASATARSKPATLQTGLIVQVPEYLSQGEVIKVDTRHRRVPVAGVSHRAGPNHYPRTSSTRLIVCPRASRVVMRSPTANSAASRTMRPSAVRCVRL